LCPLGTSCSAGNCHTFCATGLELCNGTCVDPLTDANNCGGCGNACNLPHAISGCGQGVCVVSQCAPGYGHCVGPPGIGCETNFASDPNNCGGCGNVCPSGLTCANAVCQ
jgi:hypothetical protein